MDKENLLKLYNSYRLYIFPLIVSVSSLILIAFVLYPQFKSLISSQQFTQKSLGKLVFLSSKVEALESYDQEDLTRKINYALASFPPAKDFPVALNHLLNISQQAGFSIVSMSFEGDASKDISSQSYVIKLELLGPGVLVPSLLSNIESSARLLRVNNIDVISKNDSSGANISLTVQALYADLPKSLGNTESPLPELSQKEEEIINNIARNEFFSTSQGIINSIDQTGKANPFE